MVITIEVWFDAQLVWRSRVWDKMMFGWIFDNGKAYLPCNNVVIKFITNFITPKTDPKCDFHGSDRLKTITRHNHAHYETVGASSMMFWEKLIFILAGLGRRTRPRPLKVHSSKCVSKSADILNYSVDLGVWIDQPWNYWENIFHNVYPTFLTPELSEKTGLAVWKRF